MIIKLTKGRFQSIMKRKIKAVRQSNMRDLKNEWQTISFSKHDWHILVKDTQKFFD